jgi:hypothetical protein
LPDLQIPEYPEHTCAAYLGEPERGCPGCEHIVARFGQLWPTALTCAVQDGDGEFNTDGDAFDGSFYELQALGLLPPVWHACAVAVAQLTDGPTRIDRATLWGGTISAEPGLPHALDLVDRLLTYSGLGERDECAAIIGRMAALPARMQAAVQLTLCAAAHKAMRSQLSTWQMVIHTGLMADVWDAPRCAEVVLLAARITGARAAGDRAQAEQLMHRAARQHHLGGVALTWARACAARMHKVSIVRVKDGMFDYALNTEAPLDSTDNVTEQGFMLAARAIRALAQDSRAGDEEVRALLLADPGGNRSRAMLGALCTWHAEVAKTVYGDYVAQCESSGEVSP